MKLSLLLSIFLIAMVTSLANTNVMPDASNTRFYIMKTNRMLGVAHMTVKRTKNYTGDLALAVRHERKALALYNDKDFGAAIYHSKRCRDLCIKIYGDNKIKPPMDAKFTADEDALALNSPAGELLDAKLEPSSLKDEDFMNGNMEVDIK